MSNFLPDACTVFCRDGMHFIVTPNGEELKMITSTVVTDRYEKGQEVPKVTVTMQVNICENLEQALAKYKEAENA